MRRGGMWLALAVVVLVNLVVLAGVAYNRSGTPDARMVLTARELPASWGFDGIGSSGENSGLSLRIDWLRDPEGEQSLFTREKMEALGFQFPSPKQYADWEHYKQPLDRMAFALFEYGGARWDMAMKAKQAELAKQMSLAGNDTQRKNLQMSHEHFEKTTSRLVLVDLASDPSRLRASYPDGSKFLIAKVKVSVYFYVNNSRRNEYELQAHISTLLPDEVHVPRQFHGLIQKGNQLPLWKWKYRQEDGEVPPYQVTLAYGQRLEPWVESVAVTSSP